jgi:lysophospholipase L1-like esterase
MSASAAEPSADRVALLKQAKRIVFLGDSITASGGYVALFDAWLRLQNIQPPPVVINCGLSSETVSGLSEDGHAGGKFPRPDLFERLDRVLAVTKPDLVFACYGINCGIYQPLAEERFARYRQGIENLKSKVEAVGAKLVIITPPFFDDARRKGAFSYNEVLDHYAAWEVEQGAKRADAGWRVVDLHTAMTAEVKRRRDADPKFMFQPDAVHPNDAGHAFMAQQLIGWFDPSLKADDELAALFAKYSPLADDAKRKAFLDLTRKRTQVLHGAYLSAAGHKRPGVAVGLPLDEAEQKYREFTAELNALLGDNSKP